jgi:hypothetical protein
LGQTCCEHFASQSIDWPTLVSSSFALNRSFVLTIIIIITNTMQCCMHMVSDISRNEKPYKQESKQKWKTLIKKPKKEEERNPSGKERSSHKWIRKDESHQKARKKERGAHSNENEKLCGKNLT